jgi:hypothetical protein
VPTADRAKGTVLVKVAFERLDPRILPEMSAKVAFLSRPLTSDETQPFLAVHRDTLAERDSARGIFKIVDERAQWLPLPPARTFGDFLVLAPPMKPGEQMVMKPPLDLKTGDRIKVAD